MPPMNTLSVPRRLTDFSADAVALAPRLLGKFLCRRLEDGTVLRRRITETEAYFGEEDTACHAHRGRMPRRDVLYEPGGCAYVYLCYGMHDLLNECENNSDSCSSHYRSAECSCPKLQHSHFTTL